MLQKTNFFRRYYTILVSILGFSLLLFLIQEKLSMSSFWYSAVGNIASALLISGTLSLLYRMFLKIDEENKMLAIFNISKAIQESGLTRIEIDSTKYDFQELIRNSNELYIVMNDGLRWVGNNSPVLEERFNRKGTITEFYLVDPDSFFCEALAIKTEVCASDLKTKILQTISLLESTYKKTQKKGSLKVYLLKNYPTQSLFYTESKIVVTPYQTSSGRNIIPLYEYCYQEQTLSIGTYLYKDLSNVRKESTLYSENGRKCC